MRSEAKTPRYQVRLHRSRHVQRTKVHRLFHFVELWKRVSLDEKMGLDKSHIHVYIVDWIASLTPALRLS